MKKDKRELRGRGKGEIRKEKEHCGKSGKRIGEDGKGDKRKKREKGKREKREKERNVKKRRRERKVMERKKGSEKNKERLR